jgi:hypothetical protein
MEDTFGRDDVRELQGASIRVMYTNKDGRTDAASEYMPGSMLSINIEASDVQVSVPCCPLS